MRFYVFIAAFFVGVACVTYAIQHPFIGSPVTTGCVSCIASHKTIVLVPVQCRNNELCEAPVIADICDQMQVHGPKDAP